MQPERRPALPQTIGRYRIVGRLGKGAMGVVYSALDEVMERPVAVKVMMADLEEDPETSARFYREARAAGQLAHRNVITIYDMGEDNGRPFIVMELVEGQSLGEFLQQPHAAALEVKADLMQQICEGLHTAHAHGIFHRDVKPGNLLVRPDGELKILDFGIARLASSNMTASGLIVGTPDYMSPEQARGQEVDQRSDIFSAGAVFYFILTGRKPFGAPDLRAVLNKVEREDPLPIRETEAPPELARVVAKALAKSPAARYQNCAELTADLIQFRRTFDLETRQLAETARQKLAAIESLIGERTRLVERVSSRAAPAQEGGLREALLQRYPLFSDWVGGRIVVERFRRDAVADLQSEMTRVHRQLAGEVSRLRAADSAIAAGKRAADTGDIAAALVSFEKAVEAVPESQLASSEAEKCRQVLSERQARQEELRALMSEAQKAAGLEQWNAVVALCDKALAIDPKLADAVTLRNQGAKAAEVEARERRRKEQDEAARQQALEQAKAAEAALDAGDAERALDLARRALAADPGFALGRKIEGLASARLKAQAEARLRASAAADRLREARALAVRGKFRKARELVAAATALDPANKDATATLAEINTLEARAAAEQERARLAENRARAIAPMLTLARAAEAQRDFVRAGWTAENILAIDLECAEARGILKRARETLAAQPALADETVDFQGRGADPEGTVTLGPVSPWRRFVNAVRSRARTSRARKTARAEAAQPVKRVDPSGKGV